MLATIRVSLQPALRDCAKSDISLLNAFDLTILTKSSWPLIFTTLYEVVVRVRGESSSIEIIDPIQVANRYSSLACADVM